MREEIDHGGLTNGPDPRYEPKVSAFEFWSAPIVAIIIAPFVVWFIIWLAK